MKLSEAIRLGAMLRPQTYFRSFSKEGSCALGAAQEAMGIRSDSFLTFEESPWYPFYLYLVSIQAPCPACELVTRNTRSEFLIPHLNDKHRWTREAIADWIETIESQETVETVHVEYERSAS